MEESVTYQDILSEGALAEARKFLRLQGEIRFGSPGARIKPILESITDVERLEALGKRLLTAASWEKLLGLPMPRRAASRRQRKA